MPSTDAPRPRITTVRPGLVTEASLCAPWRAPSPSSPSPATARCFSISKLPEVLQSSSLTGDDAGLRDRSMSTISKGEKMNPQSTDATLREPRSCGESDELPNTSVEVPGCPACGACCFSSLKTYIRVTGDDHALIGDLADTFTHFIENRCYMLIADGHCAALSIDTRTSQFVCTIYELRPSICRDLERGSPQCLFEHSTKADRSATALRNLRR